MQYECARKVKKMYKMVARKKEVRELMTAGVVEADHDKLVAALTELKQLKVLFGDFCPEVEAKARSAGTH